MGNEKSLPKIPAGDLTRGNDKRCGWLCKAGLNNTKLTRRYCIIQGGKLYYYLGPRSEAPNGIVTLSGAVVQQSDRIPYGFEIVAGELYSSQHIMKRTYYFTPAGADENKQGLMLSEKEILQERNVLKQKRDMWIEWLRSEVAEELISSKINKPKE